MPSLAVRQPASSSRSAASPRSDALRCYSAGTCNILLDPEHTIHRDACAPCPLGPEATRESFFLRQKGLRVRLPSISSCSSSHFPGSFRSFSGERCTLARTGQRTQSQRQQHVCVDSCDESTTMRDASCVQSGERCFSSPLASVKSRGLVIKRAPCPQATAPAGWRATSADEMRNYTHPACLLPLHAPLTRALVLTLQPSPPGRRQASWSRAISPKNFPFAEGIRIRVCAVSFVAVNGLVARLKR